MRWVDFDLHTERMIPLIAFVLTKPIRINGDETTSLSFNFDELTAQDKVNITKKYKKDGNVPMVQELDSDFHLYLFAAAVRKENPSIEIEDILRMNAQDSIRAEALVRDFFYNASAYL